MNDLTALSAIQRRLSGKELNYKQILAIMDEIANARLGPILTTYFAASSYVHSLSDEELFYFTQAMVATGEKLKFRGVVADKHSIGGVPGTRTTMIVVPIVASAGFIIPKSSSRAITSAGGTADDMEVLSPVVFNKEQIYKIVEKTNGCIVWGGGVDIAPADDELIEVEKPLGLESFDKILVSIMAKKIAFGSNHIVIDLPYGEHVKVHNLKDAELIKKKFEFLARKFKVKIRVLVHKMDEPAGRGIGPLLEAREALRVLEQTESRPLDLESKALDLAGNLLDLSLESSPKQLQDRIHDEFGNGRNWAQYILSSGHALTKMKEIIRIQGGNSDIISGQLMPGKYSYSVMGTKNGKVKKINSKNAIMMARILGAPANKKSGVYLEVKIGDRVEKGEKIYSFYSDNENKLKEALDTHKNFPILEYV